jgi:hypothetical protein
MCVYVCCSAYPWSWARSCRRCDIVNWHRGTCAVRSARSSSSCASQTQPRAVQQQQQQSSSSSAVCREWCGGQKARDVVTYSVFFCDAQIRHVPALLDMVLDGTSQTALAMRTYSRVGAAKCRRFITQVRSRRPPHRRAGLPLSSHHQYPSYHIYIYIYYIYRTTCVLHTNRHTWHMWSDAGQR